MMMLRNLFFLLSVTIVALAALVLNVFNYNPYLASNAELSYFYLSCWITVAGLIAIIIIYIKSRKDKTEYSKKHFWSSVRQGLFVGGAVTALLLLKGMGLLDLLIGIPTVIAIVLLELFFQTKRK